MSASSLHGSQVDLSSGRRTATGRSDWMRKALRKIGVWLERSRQRHVLAELDARLLQDVGLSRDTAAREAAKPFWRR